MIEAILFDLDDTLLGNNMDTFVPGYFAILGKHAERFLDRGKFLEELLISTQAMMHDTDPATTNRDVFWTMFQGRTGLDQTEMEPFFDGFYQNEFPQLASLTQLRPVAADLMRLCFEKRLKVVIATNPMFPRLAIEHRLAWAGVPVSEFDYDLVTSYEIMHAAKPHVAYFIEILEKIQCPPTAALMVGDDWKNDIQPAAELGLNTYWINQDGSDPPDISLASKHGSLADLYQALSSDWLQAATIPGSQAAR